MAEKEEKEEKVEVKKLMRGIAKGINRSYNTGFSNDEFRLGVEAAAHGIAGELKMEHEGFDRKEFLRGCFERRRIVRVRMKGGNQA